MKRLLLIIALIAGVACIAALAIAINSAAGRWQTRGQQTLTDLGMTAAAIDQAANDAEQRRRDELAWQAIRATQTAVALQVQRAAAHERRWGPVYDAIPWIILALLCIPIVAAAIWLWHWGAGIAHCQRIERETLAYERDIMVEHERKAAGPAQLTLTDSRAWSHAALPEPAAPPALPDAYPTIEIARIRGNILLVGNKGSGKSTLLYNLVKQRDGHVLVMDPHHAPGQWGPATVIGGGLNWPVIENTIDEIGKQLTKRYALRAESQTHGTPITFVADEWRAITRAIPKAGKVLTDLITQGRKVGLWTMAAAHGDTAESIGAKGEKALFLNSFDWIIYMGGFASQKLADDLPMLTHADGQCPAIVAAWSTADQRMHVLDIRPLAPQPPAVYRSPMRYPERTDTGIETGTQTGSQTEKPITDDDIRAWLQQGTSKNEVARKLGGSKAKAYQRIKNVLDAA